MGDVMPYMFEGNRVSIVMIDGEPWWVANDVCRVLEFTNSRKAVERLDPDDVTKDYVTDDLGRSQLTNLINESGVYTLIMRSNKPQTKEFKHWVTHVVLRSIRKTGSYGTVAPDKWAGHPVIENTRRWLETNERVERIEITVDEYGRELKRVSETTTRLESEFAPKVRAYEEFLATDGTWTLKRVADHFGFNGKGRQTMVNRLRDLGILCKRRPEGGVSAYAQYYQEPTKYFVQKFDSREKTPWIEDETVGVTPVGVEFLRKKLFGDLPRLNAA